MLTKLDEFISEGKKYCGERTCFNCDFYTEEDCLLDTIKSVRETIKRNVSNNYVRQGDIIKNACTEEEYIVARVEKDMYNLINLENGNRWGDPFEIDTSVMMSKGMHIDKFTKLTDFEISMGEELI